jgi:hypothetical protein
MGADSRRRFQPSRPKVYGFMLLQRNQIGSFSSRRLPSVKSSSFFRKSSKLENFGTLMFDVDYYKVRFAFFRMLAV